MMFYTLPFHKQSKIQPLSKHPKFCFCTILTYNFLEEALLTKHHTENVLCKQAAYHIDQIIFSIYYSEKSEQTYKLQYVSSMLCTQIFNCGRESMLHNRPKQ